MGNAGFLLGVVPGLNYRTDTCIWTEFQDVMLVVFGFLPLGVPSVNKNQTGGHTPTDEHLRTVRRRTPDSASTQSARRLSTLHAFPQVPLNELDMTLGIERRRGWLLTQAGGS